jgi:hypothetical protein
LRILKSLVSERLLESLCELVGAGCSSASAVGAFYSFDNIFCLHALDELGDALGVTVAAAYEFCGFDGVVVCKGDFDLTGTGAFCGVFDRLCHNINSFALSLIYKTLYHRFGENVYVFSKKMIFVNIA